MMVAPVFVFQTYGLFFLRDKIGLENPVADLGNMVLLIGAGIAITAYFAGWASDRFGRKPVILAGVHRGGRLHVGHALCGQLDGGTDHRHRHRTVGGGASSLRLGDG